MRFFLVAILVIVFQLQTFECSVHFIGNINTLKRENINLLQKLASLHNYSKNNHNESVLKYEPLSADDYEPFESIENKCLINYQNLAQANADFFRCVLKNARPFRVCRNCLSNYTQVLDARKLISEVSWFLKNLYKMIDFKNFILYTKKISRIRQNMLNRYSLTV